MRFVIRRQRRGRVLGYTSPSPAAGGNADQINAFLCEYKKTQQHSSSERERAERRSSPDGEEDVWHGNHSNIPEGPVQRLGN